MFFDNPYHYTKRSGHTPKRPIGNREIPLTPSKKRYLLKAVGEDSRGSYQFANQYATENAALRKLGNICRAKNGKGRGFIHDLKIGGKVVASGDRGGIEIHATGIRRHANAAKKPAKMVTINPLSMMKTDTFGGRPTARFTQTRAASGRKTTSRGPTGRFTSSKATFQSIDGLDHQDEIARMAFPPHGIVPKNYKYGSDLGSTISHGVTIPKRAKQVRLKTTFQSRTRRRYKTPKKVYR